MELGIGTYSFGGLECFFGLGMSLTEKFEKIAGLGFKGVELLEADFTFNTDEEILAACEKAGLKVMSVHGTPSENLIKRLAAVGGKALICPGTPFNCKKEALEVAAWLEEWAEKAEPFGVKIGYHNHSWEFFMDEGKPLWEHVADNTTKCFFQLDCGWAMNAGTYPPSLIRKYPGRFCAIHIKENDKVNGPGSLPPSRYDENAGFAGYQDLSSLPREERQKILDDIQAKFAAESAEDSTKHNTRVQCPMGAATSNMNWPEIKAALEETSPDALWIIEREEFYADHDQCIADDVTWLTSNL